MPKVSVIIPTYNRAKMVVEAIESVLTQTYKDFELIVVDDGSTDNTEEVLQPYLSHIKYIKQENQGNAAARNTGIEAATGELIAFEDSDDLWLPDKLEKQVMFMDKYPDIDMVCGNGIIFGNTKEAGNIVIRNSRARLLEKNGITIKDVFMKSTIRTPTILVKKQVVDELGGFDPSLRVCVDADFSLRLLTKYKAAFLNEPFFKLRKHDGNISSNKEQRLLHSIKIMQKLLTNNPELVNIIGGKNITKRFAYRYYKLAKTYEKKGKVKEAAESILQAADLRPFSLVYRWYQLKYSLNI